MTWLQHYRMKRTIDRSLWLMPVLGIAIVVLVVAPAVRWLDDMTHWRLLGFSPEGARAVLAAFASSMLTFVVFVVSSLLIVVQLASAQLTPRVIALVFANRRLVWVLTLFSCTFAYTIAAAARIDESAPQLPVTIAVLCNLGSLGILFWFAEWLGKRLRPVAVLATVADRGCAVVARLYPEPFVAADDVLQPTPIAEFEVIAHRGAPGVLAAFSREGLCLLAERADTAIRLIPQIGDFVAQGAPLFMVGRMGRPIAGASLCANIAIEPELTLEQDPRFAFRIMVDIANKALSPAINDPTTAVLALDRIHDLLERIGMRTLDTGQVRDAGGRLRLQYSSPDWSDFVGLATTEIRHYGAGSMQVVRRLRAMLEMLADALPEARRKPLQQELELLERTVEHAFFDPEDRARGAVCDLQGLGSTRR